MTQGTDRRDYNIAASQDSQSNFNRVAGRLEEVIERRRQDVANAMSDYQADGVSDDYAGKEQRWKNAADEVQRIIDTLRASLEKTDDTAHGTLARARAAVQAIG